ncbi:MAG: hypothetical protein K0Q95_820 [Bacteroidota bacterium]|jgi:hypothetical protein|nr:hypothetical protein [Bacteroidota bacterium]
MKKLLFFVTAFFFLTIANGQTYFHMRYGSSFHDEARKVIQSGDGNFLVAGLTGGFGSGGNPFIMKVDHFGTILWLKDYAGINVDIMFDIIELSNGSKELMMCGATNSYGAGFRDGFVMRTDSLGNLIWAKAYGSYQYEEFYKIAEGEPGTFYVSGFAPDPNSAGSSGTTIMKIDDSGNALWTKWVNSWSPQGIGWWPVSVTPLKSGGVVLCGCNQNSQIDVYKFSLSGNLIWSKQYSPGGYGLSSFENKKGEILINHSVGNINTVSQSVDICILKIDSSGNFIWDKCYGGTFDDFGKSITNTTDDGILISGETNSIGNGDLDACLIKLDSSGFVQWSKVYGSAWTELTCNGFQTSDKNYILAGQTWSVGTNPDSSKVYLVRTDSLGNSNCNASPWTPIVSNQILSHSNVSAPINLAFLSNPISWPVNNRHFYSAVICTPTSVGFFNKTYNTNVIFQNPFSDQTVLHTSTTLQNASMSIYNSVGILVKQLTGLDGETIIFNRDNLADGMYYFQIIQDGKLFTTNKCLIMDL